MDVKVQKLGLCVLCGRRVYTNQLHFKAVEGYCHNACIRNTGVTA